MRNYRDKDGREKSRRSPLPLDGLSWVPFFDAKVQQVLEGFRRPSQNGLGYVEGQRALALPIQAFEAVSEMAENPTSAHHHDELLWLYAEEPELIASLLLTLTKYHQTSTTERTLARIIQEEDARMGESDFPSAGFFSDARPDHVRRPVRLSLLAQVVDARVRDSRAVGRTRSAPSLAAIKNELAKQRSRRQKILRRWSENLDARGFVTSLDRNHGTGPRSSPSR
ncbi:MAG TPA: hypothetical protein DCM86_12020 [Verrucomicrobiales bacterium]|nr:hypothetical protein [Verrucomicrobiales bacterium]